MSDLVKPVDVLMVEDNPGDVRLVQEALTDARLLNHFHIVSTGEEAIDFLQQTGEHADAPQPGLILLDLKLPGISGLEVLEHINGDPRLQTIPVVVLTSSDAESDILAAYNLHANCYITKPVSFDKFMEVVREIEVFWLAIVKLPPKVDS